MPLTLSRFVAPVALAAALLPSVVRADPAWRAFPEETIAAVRMPSTAQSLTALREQTAFGQQILTEQRIEQVKQLFLDENQEEWNEFTEALEEVGMTTDQFFEMLQSNWSLGITATPREGRDARMTLLYAADMTEEQIDQFYTVLDRAYEDGQDQKQHPATRVDLELAGLDVRQYSLPQTGMDREATWELPDNFADLTEEQRQAHWDQQQRIDEEAKEVVTDQTQWLVTRLPGRLVMTMGVPQSDDQAREAMAGGEDIDWDAVTDVATVHAVTNRFLEALQAGDDGGFATRMLGSADVQNAVPAVDTSIFEFYVDVPAILALARAEVLAEEGSDQIQTYDRAMSVMGFDKLGFAAGSLYLDGQAMQLRMAAEMPAPRAGLLSTLDGQTAPTAPPAWVPATATYAHFAYDLGKLYDVVVQMVTDLSDQDVTPQIQQANAMVQGMTQADIPTILRALGTKHAFVIYEGREFTHKVQEYDPATEQMKEVDKTSYMQPGSFVWDLADANVWQRVFQVATPFVAGQEGISSVQEQGFTGLRLDQTLPIGLMLGQGKMIFAVGPDATARTLAVVNTPPAGEDALVNAPVFTEAQQLLGGLEAQSIGFAIQDGGQNFIDTIRSMVLEFETNPSAIDPELLEKIKAVIPTDEEVRASFGASVMQLLLTDSALVYEQALGLPAE